MHFFARSFIPINHGFFCPHIFFNELHFSESPERFIPYFMENFKTLKTKTAYFLFRHWFWFLFLKEIDRERNLQHHYLQHWVILLQGNIKINGWPDLHACPDHSTLQKLPLLVSSELFLKYLACYAVSSISLWSLTLCRPGIILTGWWKISLDSTLSIIMITTLAHFVIVNEQMNILTELQIRMLALKITVLKTVAFIAGKKIQQS